MAKVAEQKKKWVAELASLMVNNKVVGVVNMENLPAKQLTIMRAKLRDRVQIKMAKRRFINIAIDQAKSQKKDLEKLKPLLKGMPALIFTKENPFGLAKTLKQNKSKAAAKAGQTAPANIVIPAGPTQFAPGPIISDLSSIGLKTGVEGGKVSVREEKTVIKEGEKFTQKLADVLGKLGMTPMEIGLALTAVYEDGIIYGKDILAIDQTQLLNDLKRAAQEALAVSIEAEYATKDNITQLIARSFNEAKHVAIAHQVITDVVTEHMIKQATREAKNIAKHAQLPEETA